MASPKQFCLIPFTFVEPGLTVLHPKHLKFFLLTAVAAEWCGFKSDQNPCEGGMKRGTSWTLILEPRFVENEFLFDLWFFTKH